MSDHAFLPVTTDEAAGFGVYVHWPFCAAKCPYCDFNSHVRRTPIDQKAYARALSTEIATLARRTEGRTVSSIFFGGGTPSLMDAETVSTVLSAIRNAWDVCSNIEISLEANPTSVEADRFGRYREAGINRVSLGVQALNTADLSALGRTHSVEEALTAIEIARQNFERISFDLIYARPNQSLAAWEDELDGALQLTADHLSLYQLTIEPGTPFENLHRSGRLTVPDADLAEAMFQATQTITARQGLSAYEISNHATAGASCRHNLVYWRYGEYVGVGPGAHGRLIDRSRGPHQRVATATERVPERWLDRVDSQGHALVEDHLLTLEEMGDEFLVMGLRLREGVSRSRYEKLSGRQFDKKQIDLMVEQGFVESDGNDGLRATRSGSFLLDAVVADLAA